MTEFAQAFGMALGLLIGFDPTLIEIVGLSLRVTFSATLIACLIGLPLGAMLAILRFPGRGLVVTLFTATPTAVSPNLARA